MFTLAAVLWTTLAVGTTPPAQPDPLARARQLYNAQQYDAAIDAAADARKVPAEADAASVVMARALLERYRQRTSRDDLTAARDAIKQANVAKLTARDQVEHAIAVGESLYFDEHYSAAAETFEVALAMGQGPEGDARERLLEWWAISLDQQAQFGPETERRGIYQRILERAGDELVSHNASAVATYWLAAAARGADDVTRAWGAAVSGWIRATAMPGRGGALRADLDRLVTQAILPERARRIAPADPRTALPALLQEWDQIKKNWGQ